MENLFDSILAFFAKGGDPELDNDPTTDGTTSIGNTEPDVPEPEQLGADISNAYLDFFENYGESLYLSDLIVFKTKKDLMKEHNLKFGTPDADEEAQSLAIKSGFYDKLKETNYYNKLPFKDSILKWAPGVDQISEWNLSMSQMQKDASVDVTAGKDLGKGFNLSVTQNIGKSLKNKKPGQPPGRGNIKLIKTF